MSFTAHKLYGPKGIGALYVRRTAPAIRLQPLINGGGQEGGLRSGTLNVPAIVGFARAVELCLAEMSTEPERLGRLRDRLYDGLLAAVPELLLNGPVLTHPEWRLPGNLNVSFPGVEGQALLLQAKRFGGQFGQRLHVGASGAEPCAAKSGHWRGCGPGQHPLRPGAIQHGRRSGVCDPTPFADISRVTWLFPPD